jgi:TolA-binding protein
VAKRTEATTTSNEELLQMGTRAAQQGNKDSARVLFRQIYDRDNRNERAMFWLAKLAKTPRERQQWLNRVLKINPQHEGALAAMKKLQYRRAASDNRLLLVGGALIFVLVILAVAIFLLLSNLH